MDGLADRIARVLTDHRYLYAKKCAGGIREEFCTCGWSTGPGFAAWVDFARHQADAVIDALGLREERRPGVTTTLNDSVWTRPDKHRYITVWEETP